MADITIYKPANVTLDIIDGDPPADLSAQVAALTAERDTALAERDAVQLTLDNLNAAIDAAQGQ